VHGLVASPFKAAYVASTHGVLGLVKVLALEGAGAGITATAICPGFVRTPLVEAQIADQARAHGLPEERVLGALVVVRDSRRGHGLFRLLLPELPRRRAQRGRHGPLVLVEAQAPPTAPFDRQAKRPALRVFSSWTP
jgi:NAD(P)-dependent dehydrogenase (short-subunit alcohol dehydrogenase family)